MGIVDQPKDDVFQSWLRNDSCLMGNIKAEMTKLDIFLREI